MKFYDRITNENAIVPSVFFLITAHHPPCQLNRTWRINIWGHKIYICTRCMGQYIGILLSLIVVLSKWLLIEQGLQMAIVFGVFPFPATIDWFTQTMGLRESNNVIRCLTGFLYGISLGTCISCFIMLNFNAILISSLLYSLYIACVIYLLRKLQLIENYLNPYEDFLK